MWFSLEDRVYLWLRERLEAPKEGDDAYQRWLRATVKDLVERKAPHAIGSDVERQWIDRAVMERILAWTPDLDAVVLGDAWAEAVARERTPYETWLHGVHAAAAHEPYPVSGEQEQAWAKQAVEAGALAWDIEGVSLVHVKTGDDRDAPYR
jgi:hypothetical protein